MHLKALVAGIAVGGQKIVASRFLYFAILTTMVLTIGVIGGGFPQYAGLNHGKFARLPESIRLGKVSSGGTAATDFTIRNLSSNPLNVEISCDCSCMRTEPRKLTIPGKKTSSIELELYLSTNKPVLNEHLSRTVVVNLSTKSGTTVSQIPVYFTRHVPALHGTASDVLELASGDNSITTGSVRLANGVSLKSLSVTSPLLTAVPASEDNNSEIEYELCAQPWIKNTTINTELVLEVSVHSNNTTERLYQTRLPLDVSVRPPFRIYPEQLRLQATNTERLKCEFTITCDSGISLSKLDFLDLPGRFHVHETEHNRFELIGRQSAGSLSTDGTSEAEARMYSLSRREIVLSASVSTEDGDIHAYRVPIPVYIRE